jgi:ferritin-like protein
MANSVGFHEPLDVLTPRTRDLHRALTSLQEELEAVDWYQQRVDATADPVLKQILKHNRDEEIEHAMMVLEWLRRNDEVFANQIAEIVGKDGPIVHHEELDEAAGKRPPPGRGG